MRRHAESYTYRSTNERESIKILIEFEQMDTHDHMGSCRASERIGSTHMHITRNSIDTNAGPSEWFTGSVYIDAVAAPSEQSRLSASSVHFTPGARTAWHTHPLGQTLIVTAGFGRVQREGGPIEEIRPGDVVSIPPKEKHWHGASPNTAMTHIAIHEALDGKNVDWMEKVTDEQYGK